MALKTLVLWRSLSKKALILATTTIIMAVCLSVMFSGCTNEEEIPMEALRQLEIPSELEPEAVLPFGEKDYYECVYDTNDKTTICGDIQRFIEGEPLERDIVKGYARIYSTYTLKNGEEIGIAYPLLKIIVLKYETFEAAEEAFNVFSEANDLIIDGVKIKGAEGNEHPKEAVYILQSNNFIIHILGHIEAGRDALSRIIKLYSVPKDNSY